MRIGELSSRTRVSRRSLRYYEEQGLLASSRAASGQRHYTDDHVRRVELIQAFLAAGLSSRAIAELVPCMATPTRHKAQRAHTTMERERNRISSAIDSLTTALDVLDDLMAVNQRYLAKRPD
ncbi:MerR family transcriptional regulator [Micromonospora rubida]